MAFVDSNTRLLTDLRIDSEVLDRTQEDFLKALHRASIRIHSFQEGRALTGMKGLSDKVVDDFSSKLGLPEETVETIDADHREMIRKPGVKDISDVLKELEQIAVAAGQAVEVVQVRPKPSSTVPFNKDTMFVGREDIIREIEERNRQYMGNKHQRVALVGLAGVGKSQIAIEYSYRLRKSLPEIWVFWVHSSNMARFEQGYQEIASIGPVPGRDNPNAHTIQLVYEWLRDERNGAWLMVLDNVDDEHFFNLDHPHGKRPLVNFLPQVSHGSILLTSRNRLAARNLVGEHGHVITIDVMNEEESLNLLRTRCQSSQSPTEDEKALVKELEFIPLAITQAGSYIANRSTRITVSKYLQLFNESETNRTHLLNHEDAKDLRRDPSIRHSIITTWQLSFEQIRRDQPPAADLLALMSMFDRQGIPEDLARENQDTLQFEDMLAPLLSFSLIREQTDKRSFDMHRLVRLSVRRWLEIHQQLDGWREKSREAMAQIFPNGEYEDWTTCLNLLPHSKEVLKFAPLNDQDRLNTATIASKCGYYLFHRGAYEEANIMYQQALEAREKVLGRDHQDTLTSVSNLGCVFQRQGNYKEAETMHRRALKEQEKLLGYEHPGTLTSVGNLGSVLEGQGKYEEAEAIHRRALKGREKVLGHNHQDTITSVSNLGCVFQRQGNYKEAEMMHRRALEGREKLLGYEHPGTLTSVGNLGSVLEGQGKYEEAEAMYRRDSMVSEKVLGHEHPDTLASINNLGCVLQRQRKYKEVEIMYRRSIGVYEKGLGYKHPDALTTISNIGFVLQRQGKYEEAKAMYRRALAEREKVLGYEHPDTLASASRLGSVLQSQGKYEEAEAMHRRALAGRKKVLGYEHPSTLASATRLSFLLQRQGKNEDTRALRHGDSASASMTVFNLSGMHIGNADQP